MTIDGIIKQAQELSKKNWIHAMHILQNAEDQHPDEPRLQTTIADLFITKMHYQSALKHYLRALAYEPDNPLLIQAIASCYLAQREYRLALVYYLRIKNPSEDILYNIGYTQALLGKKRDSIATMQKLLTRLPNHPFVYYVIIEQYYELGETDEALRYLRQARQYCGENMQLSLFGGLLFSAKGMHMQAYYSYSQAASSGKIKNPDHMIRFASSALNTGLPLEAIRILQDAEGQWPYLSEIYVNQMRTYLYLGDVHKAKEVLMRARKKVSRHSPSLRLMEERLKEL